MKAGQGVLSTYKIKDQLFVPTSEHSPSVITEEGLLQMVKLWIDSAFFVFFKRHTFMLYITQTMIYFYFWYFFLLVEN